MTTPLERTGSLTVSTPSAGVAPMPPPAAVTEPPSLWENLKSAFFGSPAPAPIAEPKTTGFAEKLFCGKLGIASACSEESIQEGDALARGLVSLFDGGKNFLSDTTDKAIDAAKELYHDPMGFLSLLASGPRHGGGHAAVSGGAVGAAYGATIRPRPRPVSLTAKK